MCVARSCLVKDQESDLTALTDGLTAWASSVFMEALSNSRSDSSEAVLRQSNAYVYENQHESWPAADERSLIVLALAKLVAVEEFDRIGPFKEVMDWSGYVAFLTNWATSSSWEGSTSCLT